MLDDVFECFKKFLFYINFFQVILNCFYILGIKNKKIYFYFFKIIYTVIINTLIILSPLSRLIYLVFKVQTKLLPQEGWQKYFDPGSSRGPKKLVGPRPLVGC